MEIAKNLYFFPWNSLTANNCNTYFIDGPRKILVDPGHYHLFGHVRDELSRLSLTPEDIDVVIVTHGHPDHMEGVREFENLETLIALHPTELTFIKSVAPHYGEALGIADFEPEILLQEGDQSIAGLEFRVLHTPGHSPGSICLYWPETKVLFTGDVVFNQGIGRTDLPGGDGSALKESIRTLSHLNADYLLTGHGDVVSGADAVQANFEMIKDYWFSYL